MNIVRRLSVALAAMSLAGTATALPAAAATPTPTPQPSMRVHFGQGGSGETRMDVAWPEYNVSRYRSPLIFYTVVNTGPVALTIDDTEGCPSPATVPVKGMTTCAKYVSAPYGAPGTTTSVPFPVTATAGGTTLRADLGLDYRFYDVLPQAFLGLAAGPSDPKTATVRFQVLKYPPMPWVDRVPDVVSLTSSTFGDLQDPKNPLVTDNTCAERTGLQPCEFTARMPGAPGATATETVSMVLTDGTGPTRTMAASTQVAIPVPPVRDAATWAAKETSWPALRIRDEAVTRKTRTAEMFALPRRCARTLPRTLDGLLESTPRAKGGCREQWRLTRAATTAMLNEAARVDHFPAGSPEAVVSETNRVLGHGTKKAMSRLSAKYEGWNGA